LEDVCPQNIALKWHAEASSAIYATPLITDLFSDGRKDIVVPSFLHQLEVRHKAGACCLRLNFLVLPPPLLCWCERRAPKQMHSWFALFQGIV
jgi:hypothetical protein